MSQELRRRMMKIGLKNAKRNQEALIMSDNESRTPLYKINALVHGHERTMYRIFASCLEEENGEIIYTSGFVDVCRQTLPAVQAVYKLSVPRAQSPEAMFDMVATLLSDSRDSLYLDNQIYFGDLEKSGLLLERILCEIAYEQE